MALVRRRFLCLAGMLPITSAFGGSIALAQNAAATFPERPIRLIVPYTPGGPSDVMGRLISECLSETFAQQAYVDNRPGAGSTLGGKIAASAEPDGYTLLIATAATLAIGPTLYPDSGLDPKIFVPIAMFATVPFVMVGGPKTPPGGIAEIVAYAKAHPGKLSYGSQGRGQIGHLTMELFKSMTGTDILHVPYRGSAPALNDLLGGQVDVVADVPVATVPYIEAGKIKLLATAGATRFEKHPNVPTVGETLPGFESSTWIAFAAPPGTPKDIIRKLSDAVAQAIHSPDLNKRIRATMIEPAGTTPEDMARIIHESYERWAPVIISGKITTE